MIWPLAESMSAMVPLLPPALFTRRAAARLRSIARAARGLMDAFGFECRLARGAERVDLGARLPPEKAAAAGQAQAETEADAGIGGTVRHFTSDPERFRRLVSFVFLEYDADSSRRSPASSVFLGFGSQAGANEGLGRAGGFPEVRRLLADLMAPDSMAACEETLALCFEKLPRGGRVLVAGALLGRSPQAARVSVSVSTDRIGEYLGRLGWPHWDRDVSDLLRRLGSPVSIDFDVRAGIGPKVGVHFPPAGGIAAGRLLGELVGLGLCTPAKKRAVLEWPGTSKVRLSRRGWPCRFERYLNHVKVTFARGGIREAKAYLGVAPGLSLFDV